VAFSYNPVMDTVVDKVRFLIGDTDSEEYFLENEEITFLATTWSNKGSVYFVASKAASTIASKVAREVTTSSDGQSVSVSELQEKYLRLAGELYQQDQELLGGGGNIHVGGMNAAEQPDPTVAPLSFGTGMHDNYEAGQQDYGSRRVEDWTVWGERVP